MNKKSKIKSTLDSLFTGGRIKPEDSTTVDAVENVRSKPNPPEKEKKATEPAKKAPEAKKEPEKPAEIIKPVVVEPLKEEIVETINPPVIEPISQPEKSGGSEVKAPGSQPKPMETNQPPEPGEINIANINTDDDEEHLVIFTLGKELYGVTIHTVESIIKIQAITEVPRTAAYVLGVTNLRGTVVPVLDLRKRFNLQFSETTPNTRIIIVNAEGSKVGIVVDEVTEVLKVAQNSIQPPPPMSTTIESAFISGIARINNKLVILLDLEKVLASSSKQFNR
jgi:purine-binding chemotaxis protein CheW